MSKVAAYQAWGANERGWLPKTQSNYGTWIRIAERWFNERGRLLEEATEAEVKEFFFSRSPAPRTRNHIRSALLAYFHFVGDTTGRRDNPALVLPRLRVRPGIPRPVAGSKVQELLAAAAQEGPMEEALLTVFLNTGLRLTENRLLRWSQIEGQWARFIGKGGYERRVFLNEAARGALQRWRSVCPSGPWVFPSRRVPGQPVSGTAVWRLVKRLGDRVGLETCRPHQLRSTFATHLYGQCRDILVVQEALGHEVLASTMVYTKLHPERMTKAVSELSYKVSS